MVCIKSWYKKFRNRNIYLWTLLLMWYIQYTHAFDLISMLSQTPSLAGKLALPDLKSIVSPEMFQKLIQSRGLIPVASADASPPDPVTLQKILAQLKPKEGRLDPAMLEMLSGLDSINPNRQGPLVEHMFQRFSNSVEDKDRVLPTSSSSTILSTLSTSSPSSTPKRSKKPKPKTKYSAKFRTNSTTGLPIIDIIQNFSESATATSPFSPFDHITDPNIRNHRLYDWKFETYKNFTHLDQAEDLLAEESEVVNRPATEIFPTTSETTQNMKSGTITNGWIPRVGIPPRLRRPPYNPKELPPDSYEDVEEDYTAHFSLPPGGIIRLAGEIGSSSVEPTPSRPREPLSQSSIENQIYRNPSGEDPSYYSESGARPSEENFRPSQAELSPPVFVDPDQDFFTSTIKQKPFHDEKSDEHSNFKMPIFAPAKNNKPDKDKTRQKSKTKLNDSRERHRERNRNRDSKRDRDRGEHGSDRDRERDGDRHNTSSRHKHYSKNEHKGYKNNRTQNIPNNYKTDRVLSPNINTSGRPEKEHRRQRQGQGQDLGQGQSQYQNQFKVQSSHQNPSIPQHSYDESLLTKYLAERNRNHASQGHSPNQVMNHAGSDPEMLYYINPEDIASTEEEEQRHEMYHQQILMQHQQQQQQQQQQEQQFQLPVQQQQNPTSPLDQIYAGGHKQQYYHPFGGSQQTVYIDEDSYSSWFNTFLVLGGIVALSALVAFLLPSLLAVNAVGKDKSEVAADVDLWSEIKGVYKDIVHIVRGDYAYFHNKRKGSGINLTYRNEEDDKNTKLTGSSGPNSIEMSRNSKRNNTLYNFSSGSSDYILPYRNNNNASILNASADSFLGEWAKVQLINN